MTRRNKVLMGLIAAISAIAFLLPQKSTPRSPSSHVVAVLQTAHHPALDTNYRGIVDGLQELAGKIGAVQLDYQVAQGSTLLATQMAQKLCSESPTVLVGIGTSASQALLAADSKRLLPLVFTTVTNPRLAKLIKNPMDPSQKVTGVSNFVPSHPQFVAFKEVYPKLKRLGIIYNPAEANSSSLLEDMRNQAGDLELIEMAACSTQEVATTALALSSCVDALFINNDNTALAAFDSIVRVARANRLPLFCSDVDMISRGALVALGPDQYLLGKQTAAMIARIIKGENSSMPVEGPSQVQLHINLDVARELGLSIDPALLDQAIVYSQSSMSQKNDQESSQEVNQGTLESKKSAPSATNSGAQS